MNSIRYAHIVCFISNYQLRWLFLKRRIRQAISLPYGLEASYLSPIRPFGRGGRMYTRLTPTLDRIDRHPPDQGSKRPNLPLPPKTHLAPRRYSLKSLVQDFLKGRGWLFASFERSLSCSLRSFSGPLRKFSASLLLLTTWRRGS